MNHKKICHSMEIILSNIFFTRSFQVLIGSMFVIVVMTFCANAEQNIILRSSPDISDTAQIYLANVVEPKTIKVRSSNELKYILNQRCGTVTQTFLDIYTTFNNGQSLDKIQEPTSVRLPACFHFERQESVVVLAGDSLSKIAKRNTGWEGPRTIEKILWANNDTINVAMKNPVIQANQVLNIPFKADRISYDLKSGMDAEVVLAYLRSIAGTAGPSGSSALVEAENGEGRSRHIGPASTSAAGCSPGATNDAAWPFDAEKLASTLMYNEKIVAGNNAFERTLAIVAVADSGLSGYGNTPFEPSWFKIGLQEFHGQSDRDDDGNGYTDDIYGTNIPTKRGDPNADSEYWAGDHGTHVAGLVLGGPSFEKHRDLLSKRIKLKILNLMKRVTVGTSSGPRTSFFSEPPFISNAIAYAKNNGIRIVNVSFAANARLDSFEIALKGSPEILVIVSAGNSGERLEQLVEYPAAYGGTSPLAGSQVFSVAAHDAEFELITSSNWSPKLVDIAAPGCAIESYSYDGGRAIYDGTSQAAPLATLAAALLFAEGIESPQQIKNRLIASADPEPLLIDKVVAHGKLNIVKALNVYRDIVSLVSTSDIILGKIVAPSEIAMCEGLPPAAIRDIAKIIPAFPVGSEIKTLFLLRTVHGFYEEIKCEQNNMQEITFQIEGESELRRIKFSEIKDIVTATYR